MLHRAETYTNGGLPMSPSVNEDFHKRLKRLYPCVEDVSKLPQAWSTEFRAPMLGFTSDNLGCYLRGGKRGEEDEKSFAAVRTENHIPPSCLLYYYEIKWVSKGREGFMGLGLTTAHAPLSKLPGWASDSYGYHADDGNIFNNDGRGIPFGPTFTTGDIVGCGYNLVEGKCFFTKNGLNLGKAFDDISGDLFYYPTVGLKTSGEEIEANFGQKEFMYDIEQDLRSLRKNMTLAISDYPITNFANWQSTIHELLKSWFVQNSYPKTAEAFTRATKLEIGEDMTRLEIRNHIQQLMLRGRISKAIRITNQLCPNLLQSNPNLLFALKCRQFVELISGAENDFQPKFDCSIAGENGEANGDSTKTASNGKIDLMDDQSHMDSSASVIKAAPTAAAGEALNGHAAKNSSGGGGGGSNNNGCSNGMIGDSTNCEKVDDQLSTSSSSYQELMDIDQPTSIGSNSNIDTNNHLRNSTTSAFHNNQTAATGAASGHQAIKPEGGGDVLKNGAGSGAPTARLDEQKYAKLILFGQGLLEFLQHLDKMYGKSAHNERMLQDAVGLMAFANPRESSMAKQLDPSEREPISQLLNNSILRAELGDAHKLPLENVMNHLRKIVKLNNSQGSWLIDQLY